MEPGTHTFTASTEVGRELTLEVQAGMTYYVKCSLSMGVMAGRPEMCQVPEALGRAALASLTYATK